MNAHFRDLCGVRRSLLICGVALLLVACISKPPVKQTAVTPRLTPEEKAIHNIAVSEDEAEALVTIEANQPLTYTAVKQEFPLAVALFFRDTVLKGIEESYTLESTAIRAIQTYALVGDTPSSRIEILLNEDLPYEVTREENIVSVHFKRPVVAFEEIAEAETIAEAEEIAAAEEIAETEQTLESEAAAQSEEVIEIAEEAELSPEEALKAETMASGSEGQLESASEEMKAEAIEVALEGAPEPTEETGDVGTEEAQLEESPEAEPPAEALEKAEETGKPTWVNRIDFEMLEAGKCRVIVGTAGAIRCETEKVSDKKLLLKLLNTRIPAFHKLPLITTRFKSAVDRILPVQTREMGDLAVVAIELREAVPYRVEQKEKMCVVEFESSAIPPRPITQAERPEWIQAMKETEAAIVSEVEKPAEEPVVTETGKLYTGEKISLDFQDADIHNVFRILHEVSGKNFVIGEDVRGKVTLKLTDVPWDQVLDLVLKMNKLGTIVEGNVVRIASLGTLAAEERAVQEKRRAEQEAAEQEPLMTDYIPINYADAGVVRNHIEQIKTDRGTVTFDERTNTIIIKDIEEVIKRARELTARLDKVTPQVMIEASVVEASSEFSRQIGVQWGGQYGIWPPDDRYGVGPQRGYDTFGGTYGLQGAVGDALQNWVVNMPTEEAATSGIGFNFARLSGTTPLTLRANLQAMESTGKGRILSNPKILTLDNKEAFIKQGTNIPYQVFEEGSYSLKWQEAVLELEVTPHVTADRRISMKILVKKDSPDKSIIVQGAPAVDKKEATTELMVNNGDTIVIGGIISKDESYSQDNVPGLSKVPVLGWLFKAEAKNAVKREVLIFVTPTIVELEPAEGAEDIVLSQLE